MVNTAPLIEAETLPGLGVIVIPVKSTANIGTLKWHLQ